MEDGEEEIVLVVELSALIEIDGLLIDAKIGLVVKDAIGLNGLILAHMLEIGLLLEGLSLMLAVASPGHKDI